MDGVVKWLTRQTSYLKIASRMGSNPVRVKPLFPWDCLLSTGWFQERIWECFYKLEAFFTIELKYIQYRLINGMINDNTKCTWTRMFRIIYVVMLCFTVYLLSAYLLKVVLLCLAFFLWETHSFVKNIKILIHRTG